MRKFSVGHVRSLVVTGVVALAMLANPAASAAVFVEGTPQASWGVNGSVYATVVVGDTVIVGGAFTQAVSTTNKKTPRQNLAAFSLSTGALLTSWRLDADARVQALTTDGTNVYVGGMFLNLGGVPRSRLAKLDAATGVLAAGFAPNVSGGVKAVEVDGNDLYIAGGFTVVNQVKHRYVAKLDATTGAQSSAFQATANAAAYGLVKSPTSDTLWVSGLFDTLNGVGRLGLGGLNTTTGALIGPEFGHTDVPLFGLDISPDGSTLFGAQKSNQGAAWNVDTGTRNWVVRLDGNAQAVKYYDGTLYLGFHDGYQANTALKLLAIDPVTGEVDPSFMPSFDLFMGVHAIDVTADGLVVGGQFRTVSGVTARNFAIFRPLPAP